MTRAVTGMGRFPKTSHEQVALSVNVEYISRAMAASRGIKPIEETKEKAEKVTKPTLANLLISAAEEAPEEHIPMAKGSF